MSEKDQITVANEMYQVHTKIGGRGGGRDNGGDFTLGGIYFSITKPWQSLIGKIRQKFT